MVRADGTDAILRAQFTYQPTGTTHTDSLGHAWTYEVNAAGQIVAYTDPTGARTVQTWDRYHRLLTSTDPLGHTTGHIYDHLGNPTTTTLPDGRAGHHRLQQRQPARVGTAA